MDFGVIALHFTIQALLLSILQNPESVLCFAWSVVQSYTTSTATQGRFACGGCPPRDPLSQRGSCGVAYEYITLAMGIKVVVLEQYHGLLFAFGVPKLTTTRRSIPPTLTRNFLQFFSN